MRPESAHDLAKRTQSVTAGVKFIDENRGGRWPRANITPHSGDSVEERHRSSSTEDGRCKLIFRGAASGIEGAFWLLLSCNLNRHSRSESFVFGSFCSNCGESWSRLTHCLFPAAPFAGCRFFVFGGAGFH
jgi:hypothetical protein